MNKTIKKEFILFIFIILLFTGIRFTINQKYKVPIVNIDEINKRYTKEDEKQSEVDKFITFNIIDINKNNNNYKYIIKVQRKMDQFQYIEIANTIYGNLKNKNKLEKLNIKIIDMNNKELFICDF